MGSISIGMFQKRAGHGRLAHAHWPALATVRTAYLVAAAASVAIVLAHLPTRAYADTVRGAVDRAPAELAHLEPGVPQATGPAIDLPEATPGFGDVEPTATTREPRVTIYRADSPRNFELKLRLNPASDETQCDIALRLASPRDYYLVRIDGRGERLVFSRVSEGRAKDITSVERRVTANAWHSLDVGAEDNRFTVTLDGERLFTVYDTTFRKPGRVVVWRAAGSAVRFDAIAMTALMPE
jgi:hypothetical protein